MTQYKIKLVKMEVLFLYCDNRERLAFCPGGGGGGGFIHKPFEARATGD